MKLLRLTLTIFVALALVCLLVFLYLKTQALDYGRQSQVLSLMRELRQIDSLWTTDVLQSEVDPSRIPAASSARLTRIMEALSNEASLLHSPSLNQGLGDLRRDFELKLERVTRHNQLQSSIKKALATVLVTADQLRPIQATRAGAMTLGQVSEVVSTALRFNAQPNTDQRQRLEILSNQLLADEVLVPAEMRDLLRLLASQVHIVARQKMEQSGLLQQVVFSSAANRVDTLTGALDREFQGAAELKELFRIYLIAYSAALLIFLGYVGWRLAHSKAVIDAKNRELRDTNESLEQRVKQRTQELSEALRHLKESESMLVQSEKMSSLGQMVAGIAHEINTPLAYVNNTLQMVDQQLPQISAMTEACGHLFGALQAGNVPEEELNAQFANASDLVEQIRASHADDAMSELVKDGLHGIGQISEIVTNLRNFSRLDRSKVAAYDLHEGLDSTLNMAQHLLKRRIVKKDYADIPKVTCSPSQINQVFLNLVTNAAQATPDDTGVIAINTRMEGKDKVVIEILDNGKGIPADILPKIFDPFFTTKEAGKGTGLGLSIAYKIIDQHGGRIQVKSTPGQGTRFLVTLPIGGSVKQGG